VWGGEGKKKGLKRKDNGFVFAFSKKKKNSRIVFNCYLGIEEMVIIKINETCISTLFF
jgi:hypothetical protein